MKYLLLSITIFSFWSCGEDFFTTTLDVEAPVPDELLVSHAYVNFDSLCLDILVSETNSILDDVFNSDHLDNSNVKIGDDLDNIVEIPLESSSAKRYKINAIDENATVMSLAVESMGYENIARAEQEIPQKIEIVSAAFFEDGGIDTEGDDRSAVEIVFNDPAGVENYYEAVVIINEFDDESQLERFTTFTDSNDPIVSKGSDYYSVIFDDSTFDGQEKKVKLLFYPISEIKATNSVYIQWRCISKAHYQFSKTFKQFNDQEDNPFSTPVQIFSNIENGIGIFSVFREEIKKVF